jgi:hypothetical protein
MSFSLRLNQDLISVEPGSAQALAVEISHKGDEAELYELAIEGIDPSWVAIPVPSFEIEPHGVRTEKLLVRMQRETENRAGTYPFVVKVRSLATGESKVEQVLLEIRPYHNINIDIQPKKSMVTPLKPMTKFEVTLMNLGNQLENVQLYATDLDDACVFDLDQDRVTLAPGAQKIVTLDAGTSKKNWITTMRLHGFTVTARSTEVTGLMSSSQAQLEQRAAASPGAVVGVVFAALLVAAWVYAFPKPPHLDDLIVDKKVILEGESARVDWKTKNAAYIEILVNGEVVKKSFDERGFTLLEKLAPGEYRIVGRAMEGSKKSELTRTLKVDAKPDVPAPEIDAFTVSPERIPLGDTVKIRYKLGANVVKATLQPMGQTLDPNTESIDFMPTQPGSLEFTLIVENTEGETESSKRTITVYKESKAKIISFRSEKLKIEAEQSVKLDWQASNAVRAEINDGATTKDVENGVGSILVSPTKTTTYTLTVYDSDGEKSVKRVTVQVTPKPKVEPDPAPDDPATTPTDPPTTNPTSAPDKKNESTPISY